MSPRCYQQDADHHEHHAARSDAEAADDHRPLARLTAQPPEVELLVELRLRGAVDLVEAEARYAYPSKDHEPVAEGQVHCLR